jgi:hypothetical protein
METQHAKKQSCHRQRPLWKDTPASPEAIKYWALAPDAKLRDVFVAIRADEVAHREYNHHFADMKKDQLMTRHKLYIQDEKPIDWNNDKFELKANKKI